MSYCTDIAPTDNVRRVMMTGCHAQTIEASLADAIDVSTDPRGYAHHSALTLTVLELCKTCGGSGRLQRMRRGKRVPYGIDDCKACKAQGSWPVATARVVNP